MPKIKTKNISISLAGDRAYFNIEFFYSTTNGFYAVVPDKFNYQYDLLSEDDLKKYRASKQFKSRHDRISDANCKRVVSGKDEHEVENNLHSFIKMLLETTVKERRVIIVFFNGGGSRSSHFGSSDRRNKKHGEISMQLSLAYCVEVSVGGGKNKYYVEETTEFHGEQRSNRYEVQIGYEKHTIIDDTPERRIFLEQLYDCMKNLNESLVGFTKDNETMLTIISSNQKLLG